MTTTVALSAGQLRRRLAARLADAFAAEARAGTPALDARLLVAHALGIDAARLALHDDDPVDTDIEARAAALVARRIAGEPVARITGRCAFWGLEFEIGDDTLVPRPDTETVVEAALGMVDRSGRRQAPLKVLDLGAGSGILLLAILSELPKATGIATDIVPGALAVARNNAARLSLADRASLVLGDWGAALEGGFDIVLANPPYIESDKIADLQVEVAIHDPHMALDGGHDGLEAYREIFSDLDRLLANNGHGFFEVGFEQAREVAELAEHYGFSAEFHRDLGGIERVVEVGRPTKKSEGAVATTSGEKMVLAIRLGADRFCAPHKGGLVRRICCEGTNGRRIGLCGECPQSCESGLDLRPDVRTVNFCSDIRGYAGQPAKSALAE